MSAGPTGVRGIQGPEGPIGVAGPIGNTGVRGQQGNRGPVGLQGPTGIPGSTGIQLYGNGSLVQSASLRDTQLSLATSTTINVPYTTKNPALVSGASTTISGQYDTSGLNYYGIPLSIGEKDEEITIPAGKYWITAIFSNGEVSPKVVLQLDDKLGNNIAKGIPANFNGISMLQHYYEPRVDTKVSFRVFSDATGNAFKTISSTFPNTSISIVKIW